MILAFGRPTDMVKRIQIGCIWRPNRCTRPHSCRIQSKHAYRSKQAQGHSKLPRNNPKAAKKKNISNPLWPMCPTQRSAGFPPEFTGNLAAIKFLPGGTCIPVYSQQRSPCTCKVCMVLVRLYMSHSLIDLQRTCGKGKCNGLYAPSHQQVEKWTTDLLGLDHAHPNEGKNGGHAIHVGP